MEYLLIGFIGFGVGLLAMLHLNNRIEKKKKAAEFRFAEEKKERDELLSDRHFLSKLRKAFVDDWGDVSYTDNFYIQANEIKIKEKSLLYEQIKEMIKNETKKELTKTT